MRPSVVGHATAVVSCLLGCGLSVRPVLGLTFQFDYVYDSGFFTDPQVNPQADAARAALEHAARGFEMYLDRLSEIRSNDPNDTWQRGFWRPDTGEWTYVPGGVIAAGTLVVYVGARDMGDGTLGEGGPGGRSISYITEGWRDTVRYRGQQGAAAGPATDFGPWGGSIAFNSVAQWSFDVAARPANDELNDFYSVASHELCHLLGVGTAPSWDTYVVADANEFHGPAAMAAHGGPVPLDDWQSHWAEQTDSIVGGNVQEAAMTPWILVGSRKRLTALDRAALADIGWEMALPGDADHDGDVDALDYVTLKANYGRSGAATWMEGDFDDDGDVDRADLLAMKLWFGQSVEATSPPVGPAHAAPAPGPLLLLAAGACAMLFRPPRHRSGARGPRRAAVNRPC